MSTRQDACDLIRSDVWFEDGTVVLQADNTVFRVYAGLLSRHSAYFNDLFSAPRPANTDSYEGCLLIIMRGDSSAAVRNFLLAMLDVEHFESLMEDPYATVAILKLSEKYEVDKLRRRVINALAPFFPTTLSAFDELRAQGATAQFHQLRVIYHIISLELALESTAPSFLPYLLHFLAGQKTEVLNLILSGDGDSGKSLIVSPRTRNALLVARQRLSALARKEVFAKIFEVGVCEQAGRCNGLRLAFIIDFQSPDGYLDPLQVARAFDQDLPDLFCPSCAAPMSQSINEGRARVWDQLPKIFDLPSWDELKKRTFGQLSAPLVDISFPNPPSLETGWVDVGLL